MGRHLDDKLKSKTGLASGDYLSADTVHQLIAVHQSGRADHSRALWLIWMFEEFLEGERKANSLAVEQRAERASSL
jgi:hypothetical protein